MSKKFKTSEEKKIIVSTLKDFFIKSNFQCINTWELSYDFSKIVNNDIIYRGAFAFSNHSTPAFGNWITIVPIEKLIQEIQYPTHDFSQGEDYQITIKNTYSGFSQFINGKFDGTFENRSDYILFAEIVENYIETDGLKFIDRCSFLPNVLAEMNKLDVEKKGWHTLLSGNAEHLFRGLIISKLCNDPKFDEKLNICDSKFSTIPLLIEPYYEKLKARLETLEPLYTLDSDGIYQVIPQPILPKVTKVDSSNLEIENKKEIKNSDLIPETVIEIEHFDAVHLEKLNNFLSNIHKHTIEASQARDDDMLNREELLYFQEIHREQINKAIGDTPIHKAMKLERIEISPNNTNEFAIYYYALDFDTITLTVYVTLSPEGWVEDSIMIVD